MVDIFQYLDYRQFLSAAWAERKAQDRRFSHRFIALRAGFASSGFFARVLSGAVNLTPTGALRLAEIFRLGPRESRYFELLVLHSQARSPEEKALFLDRIAAWRRASVPALDPDQVSFLADWRAVAVLQSLDFVAHRDDHEGLGKLLHPSTSGQDVARILELLAKLGLASKNEDGIWQKTEAVSTVVDPDHDAVVTFQRETMALGMDAIDRFPRSRRSISTLTLSVSEPTFERLRERLRLLRREALEMARGDDHPDRVLQMNFQLFPLAGLSEGNLR